MSMRNKRMLDSINNDDCLDDGDYKYKTLNVGRQIPMNTKNNLINIPRNRKEEEKELPESPELPIFTKVLPKKRLFLSSFGKLLHFDDEHWTFKVNVSDRLKNVSKIRWVSANISYVVPPLSLQPKTILIFIDNFPSIGNKQFELTSDGTKYHSTLPVIPGNVGTTVNYYYEWSNHYETEIYNSSNIIDGFHVKVYKEDPITDPGNFIYFTDLTHISIELEITQLTE